MFVDYVLSTFLVQNNTAKYSKEQLGALPFQTCDMKREGAGPPVNVDVACQAPSDHLQIVESHNPLQEVIPVLIVNLKDIFRSETNVYIRLSFWTKIRSIYQLGIGGFLSFGENLLSCLSNSLSFFFKSFSAK